MVRPGVYHHQLFHMEPAVFRKQRFSDVRIDVCDSTAMEQKCGLLFLKQLFPDIMGKKHGNRLSVSALATTVCKACTHERESLGWIKEQRPWTARVPMA